MQKVMGFKEIVMQKFDLQSIQAKCCFKNPSLYFCCNKNCQLKTIFICLKEQCKCNNFHEKCQKSLVKNAWNIIDHKRNFNSIQLKKEVHQKFDQIIHSFNQLKDFIANSIEQNIEFSQLTTIEIDFLHFVSGKVSQEQKQFNEAYFRHFWRCIKDQTQMQNRLNDILVIKLQNLSELIEKSLEDCKKQISFLFDQQARKKFLIQKLSQQSLIIDSNEYAQRMVNALHKNTAEIKFLFRASEQNFSMAKYFQLCGEKGRNLIVCKTSKDKIICGYTPLPHYAPHQLNKFGFQQFYDHSNQSFVFSLSNNDKFELKKNCCAIVRYPCKNFIQFGNYDLTICDQANTRNDSYMHVNQKYFNANYKENQDSYQALNGSTIWVFNLKEWEAWQIETFNQH